MKGFSTVDTNEKFKDGIAKFKSMLDVDRFALDHARRLPVPMGASQGAPLSQDQLNELMNDPQLQELGGNLYIAKMFHYIANFTFAGNGTIAQTIQIDSDADFQLLMLLADYTSALATVNVTEGGSGGLSWMSAPVNIDLFAGSAQLPFPAGLIPQLLPKKRVYNISIVNTSGAANTIQISFWGYKLFPAAQAAQLGAVPSQQ
jgi:hypothetical protein